MKKRGQVAVEFITTYGWALLAILVTLGLFSYFGLFSPDRFISQYCNTGSQITCTEIHLEENGAFRINFRNEYPVTIEILSINATIDGITTEIDLTDTSNIIFRGESKTLGNQRLNDTTIFEGNKKEVGLAIEFRREEGTQSYIIRGSSVVQISERLCGDDNRDLGEQCDGPDTLLNQCAQLPEYDSSNTEALACTPSCTYSTINC